MESSLRKLLCLCLLSFLGSGCVSFKGISLNRMERAEVIAGRAGFISEVVATPVFHIQTFFRIRVPGQPLKVYIEGDGLAWMSRSRVSKDPTPIHPVALELAVQDPSNNVAYLARPCQYTQQSVCQREYWTSARFSEDVISSQNAAVEVLKERSGASSVELTGFSGGGAVALLVAARREDVSLIRTVAGNLDPQALNRYHKVSRLSRSLDPLDVAFTISHITQWHFVGEKDHLVPKFIAENFKSASGNPDNIHIIRVKEAAHREGWTEIWSRLLSRSSSQNQ